MSQAQIHFSQKVSIEKDTQFQIQLKQLTEGKSSVELHPLNSLELQDLLYSNDAKEGPITKINITNDGYFFHTAIQALGEESLKEPSRLEKAEYKHTFAQFIEPGSFKEQQKAWGYRTMFTPVQDEFKTFGNVLQVIASSAVNFGNWKYAWRFLVQPLFVFQFVSFENGNFLVLIDGNNDNFSLRIKKNMMKVLESEMEKILTHDSNFIGYLLLKSYVLTVKELIDIHLEDVYTFNWARTTSNIYMLKLNTIEQLFALSLSEDSNSLKNIIFNSAKSNSYYEDLIKDFVKPFEVKQNTFLDKSLDLLNVIAYKIDPFDDSVSYFSGVVFFIIPTLFHLLSVFDNFATFLKGNQTMVQLLVLLSTPMMKIFAKYFFVKNILIGLSPFINRYVITSPLLVIFIAFIGYSAVSETESFVKVMGWLLSLDQNNVERVKGLIGLN